MTTKDIKAAIDEAIAPRLADYDEFLVGGDGLPFVVERAELLYVFDQYGQQYLDFAAGRVPLGHSNGAVHSAISEHLRHYLRTGPQESHVARWPVEYAKMLAQSFPVPHSEQGKVLYTVSGFQAMDAALTMAQGHTGKIYTATSLVTNPDDLPWDSISALCLFLINKHGVALDPYQVQQHVSKAKENSVPVIVDETHTGFGRLGTFWGQERYQIDADITVISGPAGGGFPLGAVVAREHYFNTLAERYFDPSAGNPVICAAGAATMAGINAGVLEHVEDAATALHQALTEVQVQFPHIITDTRGAGLLQVIECADEQTALALWRQARNNGLLVYAPHRAATTINLAPPLIISETEVRRGVDMLAAACLDLDHES